MLRNLLKTLTLPSFLCQQHANYRAATHIGSPYKADRDLWLSPESRLLADSPGTEDFVYDGQGRRLVLPQDISVEEPLPLILIGPGKTLQLKNVKLVYAASLPACLQLAAGKPPSFCATQTIALLLLLLLLCCYQCRC